MKGYRIKTVSRVTGLSPELLRAWERRHGIVNPRRTAGGYREYSEEDVERLRLLAQLTSRGYSIGEVAGLPLDELAELEQRSTQGAVGSEVATHVSPHSGVVDQLVGRATEGDALGFRRTLRRALLILPGRDAIGSVLLPALQALMRQDRAGDRRPALQLATQEIGGYLGPLADDAPDDGPLAVITAGDEGALAGPHPLLATLACLGRGWRVVTAGRLISPDAMARGARITGATAALLCLADPPSAAGFLEFLDGWRRERPDGCSLVIVGAGSGLHNAAANERGARTARDHLELPAELRALEPVGERGNG